MNTNGPYPVHDPELARFGAKVPFLLLFTLLLPLITGLQCVAIDGGASELTWSLRTFGGESAKCEETEIAKVRLCWNAVDSGASGCRPGTFREFACIEETGATLFEIEPGATAFFVEPICADGLPAQVGTYQTPAEIVRTVREGEVVSLESLLIVVTDPDSCGSACTCIRQ